MTTQLLIIYVLALLVGAYILKPVKAKKEISKLPYKRMFEIIDMTIAREIAYKISDYQLREVVIVPNFENEVKKITSDIYTSMEPSFLSEIEFYHPKSYVILYISRHVREQLVVYMKPNASFK